MLLIEQNSKIIAVYNAFVLNADPTTSEHNIQNECSSSHCNWTQSISIIPLPKILFFMVEILKT